MAFACSIKVSVGRYATTEENNKTKRNISFHYENLNTVYLMKSTYCNEVQKYFTDVFDHIYMDMVSAIVVNRVVLHVSGGCCK